MKKLVTAVLLLAAFGGSVALAGPIEDRQALMKSIAGAMKASQPLKANFDAAAAKAQMQILVDGGKKLPSLFPKGSDTPTGDTKTKAGPAIWTDAAGFKAASDKLSADAQTASAATDAAGFTTALAAVTADCGACHKAYRISQRPGPARGPAFDFDGHAR
jgi:cytochrome c556